MMEERPRGRSDEHAITVANHIQPVEGAQGRSGLAMSAAEGREVVPAG